MFTNHYQLITIQKKLQKNHRSSISILGHMKKILCNFQWNLSRINAKMRRSNIENLLLRNIVLDAKTPFCGNSHKFWHANNFFTLHIQGAQKFRNCSKKIAKNIKPIGKDILHICTNKITMKARTRRKRSAVAVSGCGLLFCRHDKRSACTKLRISSDHLATF